MSLTQIVAVLRSQFRVALLIVAITMATAAALSLLLPKRYTATAELLVDLKSPDPLTGAANAAAVLPSYMATQVDVLQSGRVARRVIATLKLQEDARWQERFQDETGGRGDFLAWLSAELRKDLRVRPSRESNALTLSFTSDKASEAAAVANGFVQAYIDTSVELRTDTARQSNAFFDERAQKARQTLEAAQAKLSAYQARTGLLATDERYDIETARLQELSSQLVALQAVASETGGRSAQAARDAQGMSEVLANPVVSQLTGDLNRQRARLEELSSRLGDAHPQVVETRASIAELRRRIAAESSRVAGSINVDSRVAQGKMSQVQAALAEQRQKVLRLRQERDAAAVLEREVESSRSAYQTIVERLNQTALESRSNQANISFLETATEPDRPSSPKLFVNLALAAFLGSILSVVAILLFELMDRRIRTPADIEEAFDLPVLGDLPKAGGDGDSADRRVRLVQARTRLLAIGR